MITRYKGRLYLLAVGLAVILSCMGCQTTKLVPVYTMPAAPAVLLAPLPPLQQLPAAPGTSDDAKK